MTFVIENALLARCSDAKVHGGWREAQVDGSRDLHQPTVCSEGETRLSVTFVSK